MGAIGIFVHLPSTFGNAIFVALIYPLLVIIPFPAKLQGRRVGTDGLQILNILFSRLPALTPAGTIYLRMIQRYVPEAGAENLKSAVASEILGVILQSWQAEDIRAERMCLTHLERILDGGSLSSSEEVLVLDHLITTALLSDDAGMIAKIDEWSIRALDLAPLAEPLAGSRGGVLARLGRYAEAKLLLAPIAWKTGDMIEQAMCRLFLAYAEHGLGNTEEAHRCLDGVRQMTGIESATSHFKNCLARFEAEILQSERYRKSRDAGITRLLGTAERSNPTDLLSSARDSMSA